MNSTTNIIETINTLTEATAFIPVPGVPEDGYTILRDNVDNVIYVEPNLKESKNVDAEIAENVNLERTFKITFDKKYKVGNATAENVMGILKIKAPVDADRVGEIKAKSAK